MTAIDLNGARRQLDADTTLLSLIEAEAGTARGSAVVVDGTVVPRAEWPTRRLRDGEQVELIRAVQGG